MSTIKLKKDSSQKLLGMMIFSGILGTRSCPGGITRFINPCSIRLEAVADYQRLSSAHLYSNISGELSST